MDIAVTGHRPDKLGGFSEDVHHRLVRFAKETLSKIPRDNLTIVTGMALGWDIAIADACDQVGIPFLAAIKLLYGRNVCIRVYLVGAAAADDTGGGPRTVPLVVPGLLTFVRAALPHLPQHGNNDLSLRIETAQLLDKIIANILDLGLRNRKRDRLHWIPLVSEITSDNGLAPADHGLGIKRAATSGVLDVLIPRHGRLVVLIADTLRIHTVVSIEILQKLHGLGLIGKYKNVGHCSHSQFLRQELRSLQIHESSPSGRT